MAEELCSLWTFLPYPRDLLMERPDGLAGAGGGAGSETLDTHSTSEKLNSSVFLKDNLIVNCP